jgi:glyoxylase-like metal-dependent hydrolase (beta-lactamase superfamily II)
VEIAKRGGLPVPREAFEGQRDVALGSRVLELRDVGPGHTEDTIVVWLPDVRILFGGDLVRSAASRSLGYTAEANLEAWPASVQALIEAYGDALLIVPGHGAPGGRELLDHTLELLADSR